MKPLRIGLLGIGTVGGGTFDVLTRNAEEISRRAGRPITITHVARQEHRAGESGGGGSRNGDRRCVRRGRAIRTLTSSLN